MSDIILSKEDQYALQMIEDLNKPRGDGLKVGLKTRLHADQIKQLSPMYVDGKKNLFLSCGRKWGKTELICYILWKHALENPGSACYYVAPEGSHGRELVWENGRLQRFLGEDSAKYIKGTKDQQMVLKFKNGSYIKVIGSENYLVANGLTPAIAVYDEFKAFNHRWHVEFAPNRAAKAAPLIIIGTKPRAGNKNMDQYNEVLKYYRKHKKDYYVADRTTFDNPINHLPEQKEVIEQEIEQLEARGDHDVVQLEYYSKYVPGGRAAVFPMFSRSEHVFSHKELMCEVNKNSKRGEWAWIADPANMSTFGNIFAMLNRHTGTLYILDEIYESNQKDTSVGVIVPRGLKMCKELNPYASVEDDWMKRADDQASWFMTECMTQLDIYFSPAEKWRGTKEDGLSLCKDQLLRHKVKISDRCVNFANEAEAYAKGPDGKIPKKNDHLMDCWRYLNIAFNYDFKDIVEHVDTRPEMEEGRFRGDYYEPDEEDWTDVPYDDFDLS